MTKQFVVILLVWALLLTAVPVGTRTSTTHTKKAQSNRSTRMHNARRGNESERSQTEHRPDSVHWQLHKGEMKLSVATQILLLNATGHFTQTVYAPKHCVHKG